MEIIAEKSLGEKELEVKTDSSPLFYFSFAIYVLRISKVLNKPNTPTFVKGVDQAECLEGRREADTQSSACSGESGNGHHETVSRPTIPFLEGLTFFHILPPDIEHSESIPGSY